MVRNGWPKYVLHCLGAVLIVGLTAGAAAAQDLVLGEFRSHATIHSIGLEWEIAGDADHDAECTVNYRLSGSDGWAEAMPLYRIDSNGYDMFGGSILFLAPGTSYDIALVASDPDGGGATRSLTIATRPVPELPAGGPVYHVVPGSGSTGGSGSADDPFLGVGAADGHAEPGTIFLLHAGEYPTTGDATYDGFTIFDEAGTAQDPVVWLAAGDGPVNFPGGAWINADYVWLEGLTFPGPGGGYGLLTYNDAVGGVVRRNTFTGFYQAINLEHATDFHIADNTIVGINDPDISDFSGEGIEGFSTDGHVIAYNSITCVGDGLSVGGSNIDIYGNDIFATSDDGIELDHSRVNVRVWENRIHNAHNHGISFQPMDGAPWYVVRNQVAGRNALKLVDNPTLGRLLIAHNTFVGRGDYLVTFAHELVRAQSSNNLWIHVTPGDIWEGYWGEGIHWRTDLDHDGFYWHPDTDYPFYWDGVNYPSFAAFRDGTGLEAHGIVVDVATCFASLDMPLEGTIPPQWMTLAAGSGAIDAGIPLPNVDDGYTGALPDLGAFEYGAALPHYGPRPAGDETAIEDDPAIPGGPDDLPLAGPGPSAHPNPFNPRTTIAFALARAGRVRVAVYGLTGRQIVELADRAFPAGDRALTWNGRDDSGRDAPSGTYVVRVEAGGLTRAVKVTLVR